LSDELALQAIAVEADPAADFLNLNHMMELEMKNLIKADALTLAFAALLAGRCRLAVRGSAERGQESIGQRDLLLCPRLFLGNEVRPAQTARSSRS